MLEDSTLMEPGVYSDLYATLFTSRFNNNAAGMRHPSVSLLATVTRTTRYYAGR